MVLTRAEGQQIAERWLAEARQARDTVEFALPPSATGIAAGDMVRLGEAEYRIDRIEATGRIETVESRWCASRASVDSGPRRRA